MSVISAFRGSAGFTPPGDAAIFSWTPPNDSPPRSATALTPIRVMRASLTLATHASQRSRLLRAQLTNIR
jgi:hypothetical protein